MADAATAPAQAGGRHQRRLRNYLLDTHFQLKYTGYLVAIAIERAMREIDADIDEVRHGGVP